MTDVLRHRGPDGAGYWVRPDGDITVGLGHRRLAIIDLALGQQPISRPDRGLTLVFNGEIYNYRELRKELVAKGHPFRTASDTEVLLNAYAEWGTECLLRLRGMFAFALWDEPRRSLVLARDHFGKKPLFVHERDGALLFGSEIKSILAFGGVAREFDRASLADYLVYRYVPGPNTLFAGIRKLDPGSYAVWKDGRLSEHDYYHPPDGDDRQREQVSDPVRGFRDLFDEAVRIRMVSDVPFGAFLSGGIDSSAVVASMSRHSDHPINTFAVGFREARYSELPYARIIAERFRTNHTELVISAEDLMEHLPLLVRHSDAPVAEASNIPIYLISMEAARRVKMVLTGEGSDELFGGYPKHSAERFAAMYQLVVPDLLHRRVVLPMVRSLPYEYRRIKTAVATIGLRDPRERMPRWLGAVDPRERDRLLGSGALRRAAPARPFAVARGRTALQRALYFDQTSWLPDNLLERGDRITMAASLEARMPFMDTELAAFAAGLPDHWRIRALTQKYILRRAMAGVLPPEILRRPKVGFRVPVNEWFRGSLRTYVRDLVDAPGSLTRDLYRPGAVSGILDEHERGDQNHEKLIWTLLNLELFQQEYRLA